MYDFNGLWSRMILMFILIGAALGAGVMALFVWVFPHIKIIWK